MLRERRFFSSGNAFFEKLNSGSKKRLILIITLVIFVASIFAEANAQSPKAQKRRIEGSWRVTLTSGDFQQAERFTFIPGRSNDEGSLIFSNEIDSIPPCGTDQGSWVRVGGRDFQTTHEAFCTDLETASPSFRLKWREAITLGDDGDDLTGSGLFEVFDAAGELLFSAPFTLAGARMDVEPLPETLAAPESGISKFNWGSKIIKRK